MSSRVYQDVVDENHHELV